VLLRVHDEPAGDDNRRQPWRQVTSPRWLFLLRTRVVNGAACELPSFWRDIMQRSVLGCVKNGNDATANNYRGLFIIGDKLVGASNQI
jgi:hypothetical protein